MHRPHYFYTSTTAFKSNYCFWTTLSTGKMGDLKMPRPIHIDFSHKINLLYIYIIIFFFSGVGGLTGILVLKEFSTFVHNAYSGKSNPRDQTGSSYVVRHTRRLSLRLPGLGVPG